MRKRLAKARRILAAQTELERLAAWRFIELERQTASIDERRLDLARFLDTEPSFGGAFAGAMMRRLVALEKSRAALLLEQAAQLERRLAERTRTRRVESVVKDLQAYERRREEQLQLDDAIEASLHWLRQGSGKFEGSS